MEAHRLKVKPFSADSLKDASANSSGATPAVHNRLLYTLRSLNSAMRRKSSLATTKPVSPPAGSSSDIQRCVTFKESPARNLDNSRSNSQSGLAIVSADKSVYSTGIFSSRFSESSRQRRRGFGYLQAAFAKFRKTFIRKKDKKRSLSISDSPRRKCTENRLLLKPDEDHSVTVDLNTYPASFRTGCQVTVNIENLPRSDILADVSEKRRDHGWDTKSTSNNTSTYLGAEQTPVLEVTLNKSTISRHILDNSPDRKYPHSESHIPVSGEHLDDKTQSGFLSKVETKAAESPPQIILDVGKINTILKRDTGKFQRQKSISDSYGSYESADRIRASSVYSSNSLASTSSNAIPNSSFKQSEDSDRNSNIGLRCNETNSNTRNDSVYSRTSRDLMLEKRLTFLPVEQMARSGTPELVFSDSDSSGKLSTRSLYVSPKKSVHFSPKFANGEKNGLLSTRPDNRSAQSRSPTGTQTADEANLSTNPTECAFKSLTDAKENSGNTRWLLSGSPVPCIPSHQLPTSEDTQKASYRHQPGFLKPCLVRSSPGSDADITRTSASGLQANPKLRSLSNSDASSKMISLFSGRVSPRGRISSFPALPGHPAHSDLAGQEASR